MEALRDLEPPVRAVVIGRECAIPEGSEVGANTRIAPETEPEAPLCLPPGASLDTPEVDR